MSPSSEEVTKQQVEAFWERASCGEVYAEGNSLRERLFSQSRSRYMLEPYIHEFAKFNEAAGRDVLEVGVGMGADHLQWANAYPKRLYGFDLTRRAVDFTRARLTLEGLQSNVFIGDAEHLAFPDAAFDIVYSWGVLHHSPNTPETVREVHRVLRTGGVARVMIYHRNSIVGYLLWVRYALLRGRPTTSLTSVYSTYLESPGTKAYSISQASKVFANFSRVSVRIALSAGDLFEGAAGLRHQGLLLSLGRRLWPRRLIRKLFPNLGLFMLIEAQK